MHLGSKLAVAAALSAAVAATPAMAQKSKNTVRAISEQPVTLVDRIFNPQPATTLMSSVIFDSLVFYDPVGREYKPGLAKSWKRIDDTTLEFELRDDVKFHNGAKFDADDVMYMIQVVTDPKISFRFKGSRYGWIAGAEKLGPYKVRIKSKGKFAPALDRLGSNLLIHPHEYFKKTMQEFGKAPIGTGPYKVTQVDGAKGVVMVRNDSYNMTAPWRPAGSIDRVEITPVPERQAQVAHLLAGEIDFLFNVQADQAEALAADPRFAITVTPTVSFSYMQFDTADRSGIGVFKDQRVRKALSMAVNRVAIQKALTVKQAHDIPVPGGMCDKWIRGCAYSVAPPAYDPEGAKKLLAEAGYANGFNLELTAWGAVKEIAEAVAGDLRKVGVRAKVDYVVYGVYSKKRREGKLQTLISYWDNGGGQPDIETTMGFFYLPGERDYMRDPVLHKLTAEERKVYDLKEREEVTKQAFNRVIEKNYLMPLTALPAVVVHDKDLVLKGGHKSPEGFLYNYMSWK